jgi:hypothetical protein
VGRKKKARANCVQEVVESRNYRAHFDDRLKRRVASRVVEIPLINQKLKQLL